MAEALATLEQMNRDLDYDKMTVVGLREVCKELGITGYSAMKKDEIVAAIRGRRRPVVVEVAEPVEQAPMVIQVAGPAAEPAAEKPKSWEENFIAELQNVCKSLEDLPETHFLPEELSQIITRVKDAATVEELAELGEDTLMGYIHQIKQQLPRYQRDVYETINLIAGARPMTVDVDFV